jgi:D-alanyl-D-alanine carboxypeptidase (penicillin-binding protein 5/6)
LVVILAGALAAAPSAGSAPQSAQSVAARSAVGRSAVSSAPRITVTLPATLKIAGKAPHLPWPIAGQAGVAIPGAGSFGTVGKTTPFPIASVAKAMTAYLILKDHPLPAGFKGPTLHVTKAEASQFKHQLALSQSLVPVRPGEALTELQALQALMLASADNMAQILARWDAGSVPAFVAKMNATAKQLGMAHTHYTDPSGFDRGTTSNAADQIRLAGTTMKMGSFARIVATRSAVIPVAGHIVNVNALLGQDGVVGIKTGSMRASGGCLLFAAKTTVGAHRVTILGVVLGQRSSQIGDLHQAFLSSQRLVTSVEKLLKPHTIVKAGQVVGKVAGSHTELVATKAVTIVGWPGLTVSTSVDAKLPAVLTNGAKVGTLHISGGVTASAPVALRN